MSDIVGTIDPRLADPVVFSCPLMVIDLETTGLLGDSWAEVVELGAVIMAEDGSPGDTFGSLLRPRVLDARADEALAVNRIPLRELRQAEDPRSVVGRFLTWWRGHGAPPVTSYNVTFDSGFMRRLLASTFPATYHTDHRGVFRWARCVQARATVHLGERGELRLLPSGDERAAERARVLEAYMGRPIPWRPPRLVDAAAALGVPMVQPAHRALSDALTAGAVAAEIVRREAA